MPDFTVKELCMLRALIATCSRIVDMHYFVKDPTKNGNKVKSELLAIENDIHITIVGDNVTPQKIVELLLNSLNAAEERFTKYCYEKGDATKAEFKILINKISASKQLIIDACKLMSEDSSKTSSGSSGTSISKSM